MKLILYFLNACHMVLFTNCRFITNLSIVILNSVKEQRFNVTLNNTVTAQTEFYIIIFIY